MKKIRPDLCHTDEEVKKFTGFFIAIIVLLVNS